MGIRLNVTICDIFILTFFLLFFINMSVPNLESEWGASWWVRTPFMARWTRYNIMW